MAGDVVSGLMVDGRDAGHIYLPMAAADPHAIALLVRPRSERDLGPEALQEIFRRVVPDPQVFEALPLADMQATADLSVPGRGVGRIAARRRSRSC